MDKTSLGNRMKRYESVSQSHLSIRTPVIIRIDGKAFHTLTRNMEKPFDDNFIRCMQMTAYYLVKTIEGCNFAYTQSDEISLLLTDYKKLNTQGWFDYNIQKLTSVSAAYATYFFNKEFNREFLYFDKCIPIVFDSRCFNLPKEEVANYFIWRQKDATRNSIQMLGRAYFSHKSLNGLSCNKIQDILHETYDINWNDLPTYKKRGTGIIKDEECTIDLSIPIFTQNREYIERNVYIEERV